MASEAHLNNNNINNILNPNGTEEIAAHASGNYRSDGDENTPTLRRSLLSGNSSDTSQSSFKLRNRPSSRRISRSSIDSVMPHHLHTIHELDPITNSYKHTDPHAAPWHAFALVFVALPALAGLVYENGSAIVTDLLLLGLGCLFLYWSVKWPWQWYHSCRTRIDIDYKNDQHSAIADDEQHGGKAGSLHREVPEPEPEPEPAKNEESKLPKLPSRQAQASRSLQSYEVTALFSCFISPVALAYLLHTIRPYLSRPSGGVVSNSNLTLFTLAAEVRPILHLFRLLERRTLHLQQVVHSAEPSSIDLTQDRRIDELLNRITSLEAISAVSPEKADQHHINHDINQAQQHKEGFMAPSSSLSIPSTNNNPKNTYPNSSTSTLVLPDLESLRAALQSQIEALNRAVRHYEKRDRVQTLVSSARFRDIESRLNDTLTLLAATTSTDTAVIFASGGKLQLNQHQHPHGLLGRLIVWAFESVHAIFISLLMGIAALLLAPFRLCSLLWAWLMGSSEDHEAHAASGTGTGTRRSNGSDSSKNDGKRKSKRVGGARERRPSAAGGGGGVVGLGFRGERRHLDM